MADFNSIPVRINGQRFDASWWNSIRDALISSDTTPAFANYADDAAYEAAKGSAGVEGDYYYNTTVDFLKFHNGTDWVTVADAETAQTFTNKVIDGSVNTISNLTHGDQVDDPSSNVHGVTTDIVGVGDVQSLTNKTLDADLNTITNIEVDNFKTGVVDTDLTTVSASDDTLASAKAIKAYVDDTNTASDISYDNAASGLVATNVQDAIDEVDSDLDDHIIDTTTHGTTGSIVGTTDVQDVSNKAIIDPSRLDVKKDTFANLTTYASTATDGQLCFATDNLTAYVVHSSALNEVGGGGSGQGGINYITNYNAEEGLDDWSVVGTIPFSQETTSPLFGTASFKISSAGADYSGDYAKVATQTIDPAMATNVLSGSVWVKNEDLNSDEMGMKVYDVTNAAYVSMLQGSTIGASSAGAFSHPFKFQATDSLNYEIHFEVLDAATKVNPFDFLWDEIQIGPEAPAVYGLAGWKQYDIDITATSLTDYTAVAVPYKTLNGDWRMTFNIVAEFSSAVRTTRAFTIAGVVAKNVPNYLQAVTGITNTTLTVYKTQFTPNTGIVSIEHASGATTGYRISGDIELESQPTWAVDYSNMILSETTLNADITLSASISTGTMGTAYADVLYQSSVDSVNSYDDGTGIYTIPEDGTYTINASLFTGGSSSDRSLSIAIMDDRSGSYTNKASVTNTTTYNNTVSTGYVAELKKDDHVKVQGKNSVSSSLGGPTWFTIHKTNTGSQTLAYPVNSGDGSGVGINYITNYNAELNTDDWLVGGTIPLDRELVNPIFDTASFKLTSAGTDYQGDYVSSNFTIDNAGKYNIISGEFWYRNTDLSSGDLQVRVYDVTNAAYISVSNNEIGASLAGDTAHKFTFQASDSLSYRFEIYIAAATLPAFNFIYDNVIVKPQEASIIGAPVTDWSTPEVTTIKGWVTDPTKGTMTKDEIKYQRVGQFAFIDMRIAQTTAGTAGSSFYLYNLPSGLTVDTSEIPTGTNGSKELALSSVIVSGTAGNFDGHVAILSDTQFGIVIKNTNSTLDYQRSTILPFSDATLNISVQFKVPIAGWQSNVVMSDTTMNQNISFNIELDTTMSGLSAQNIITWGAVKDDTVNAYDPATKYYTIPEDGFYNVSVMAYMSAITSTTNYGQLQLYVNNVSAAQALVYAVNTSSSSTINVTKEYKKGDFLYVTANSNDASYDVVGGNHRTIWSIQKVSTGSQTIATSEKVYVHVTDATAQGFVAETVMNYATEIEDKHGAWDTNTFTAPRDGYYTITAKMMSSNYAWGTTGYGAGKLHILNASSVEQYVRNLSREEPGDTMQIQMGGTVTVYLDQGWKVQFSLTQNNTGTPVATSADTEYNYITILAN